MDWNHYKHMLLEQLNDKNFYRKINKCKERNSITQVGKLTMKYHSNLTLKETIYFINLEFKTGIFYGLPKFYKSKDIQNSIKGKIIHRNSKTDRFEITPNYCFPRFWYTMPKQFIWHHSENTMQKSTKVYGLLETYSKKRTSRHSLSLLWGNKPIHNILHDLGIESLDFWITKHPDSIPKRFLKEFAVVGLKLILENIDFISDNDLFL